MSTVLCVDDLRANRMLFKRLFTRHGYDVIDCADANDALKTVRDGRNPAVIVLDLFLPRPTDGFAALRMFKSDPRVGLLPVIVVSSHADPKMCDEAIRLGAVDCIFRATDERVLTAVKTLVPGKDQNS